MTSDRSSTSAAPPHQPQYPVFDFLEKNEGVNDQPIDMDYCESSDEEGDAVVEV